MRDDRIAAQPWRDALNSMLNLRILAAAVALVSFFVFCRLYGRRGGKTPILLGFLFSGTLVALAVYPDLFNGLFDLLVTSRHRYYRLIVLLVLGCVALSILLIRSMFTLHFHERSIRDLVFRLGFREFESRYGSRDIKPIQVVIPALNEAESLRTLLPRVPERLCGRSVGVLVVSDGSDDDTVDTVRQHGYPCIENLINIGQGTALRLGFELARKNNSEVTVCMDADGQHDPAEIKHLVRPILEDEADLTSGSRRRGEDRTGSITRRAGGTFFDLLLSVLLMRRITDCSTGFRAFRTELIRHLDFSEPQFFEPQFLIQMLRQDVRYKEVPVTVHPRRVGRSRMPFDLRYGAKYLSVILRNWWRS